MGEKIQVGIYAVDKFLFTVNTFGDIVDEIITDLNYKDQKYFLLPINENYHPDFELRFYHYQNSNPPQWRSFLSKLFNEGAQIRKIQNTSHAFLLFLGYKENIYAITGGVGSIDIERFISHSFGISVLTRLIELNSQVIKYINNRSVVGAVLGQSRFYRGDQRIADDYQFGAIYKEVMADLDRKILTEVFGFQTSTLKREISGCLAKQSFKINKMLDFDTFLNVVARIDALFEDKGPNFTLNDVVEISRRYPSNKERLEKLDEMLCASLYDNHKKNTPCDMDFCHKDFDKYLRASLYRIPVPSGYVDLDGISCLEEVVANLIKEKSFVDDNADNYRASLQLNFIESYDEDGRKLTRDTVFKHLHGELNDHGHSYFLIDGQWYEVQQSFLKGLNKQCKQLMSEYCDTDFINELFDINKKERDFNESFVDKPGMLVFDTVTPDGIELCDILKQENSSLYLIHVKKGFDNRIRDLASQVLVAAKTLSRDKTGKLEYITKLETRLKRGSRKSPFLQKLANQKLPAGGLTQLFRKTHTRDICFCLAFVDTTSRPRSLKNSIELFDSNIAKYSLLELRNQIRLLGFEFKIIQLARV